MLDLAVVGAGAAGTFVAHETLRRRPEWSIELFERTNRIGGRLLSVAVPGASHPIELGGMRYLHGHHHVDRVISEHGLATHAFDIGRGPDRTVLRGGTADGLADPRAGSGYDLAADEVGRSAGELITEAFERIVPGATRMDLDAWLQARPGLRHKSRPLTDWAIGEALASVLSPAGHRFVNDAFGYDSGLRGQNAADAIP
jgi:monoamine oxidase